MISAEQQKLSNDLQLQILGLTSVNSLGHYTKIIEDLMAYLLTLKKDPPPGTVLKPVQDLSFE